MLKSITSPASASRSKRRRSANPFRFCDHHVVHHKRHTRLLREIGKSLEKETSMSRQDIDTRGVDVCAISVVGKVGMQVAFSARVDNEYAGSVQSR